MRWSQSHLYTAKEAPSDAEIISHQLMIRSGMIKKLTPGIYSYGTLALRAIRKFENIIRDELNKKNCQEILMPMVQPKELWVETDRWEEMGAGLLKFKNRNEHSFCLGATHEEAVTDYVRNDLRSYKDLPRTLYQIQTKYRDEIRPRFGLMRCREFIMKDAYSFDLDQPAALKSYENMYEAYKAIFDRIGASYRIVQADAGNIGGSQTHEFQLLADAGEDSLLVSDTTSFAANIEVCPAIDFSPQISMAELKPKEKFATPNVKTIDDLIKFLRAEEKSVEVPNETSRESSNDSSNEPALVKTLFFSVNNEAIAILLRGKDELNPIKLKNFLGLANPPLMLSDAEVRAVSGANPGSCGPVGLKIPIYMDQGVHGLRNFIVGANEDGFHLKNVNHSRDFSVDKIADLRMAKEGDKCPESSGRLISYRGIEVGHVFYLGKKYSEKMKANYLDQQGKAQAFEMGCYGIGVSRTIQAIIEQSHDSDGIIWPLAIAPFQIHICLLDVKNETIKSKALEFYNELKSLGLDVLIDDRDERPGFKFKDADLLGMPYRLNVGAKGIEAGELEIIERKTKKITKIKPQEVIGFFKKEICK